MNKYYVSAVTDNGFVGFFSELNSKLNTMEKIKKLTNE